MALALAMVLELACGGAVRAEGFYASSDMPAPGGMEVEWQSVAGSAGAAVRAWVRDDLILIETDSHNLVAIRRSDGFHLWQCFLENNIRFTPSVSRSNVLVNVNNNLVGIDKRSGNIRWRLGVDFIMSTDPLLVDPPLYPREFTKEWQNLETVVLPGWDSRIHCYWTRGRMSLLIKGIRPGEDVIAPNFDLFKQWLKANKSGAFTLMPMRLRDEVMYYAADNGYINAVNLNGDEQEPYYMMGNACTELTVTSGSIFVGARDSYVYCLDRLLMKKKWSFAPGKLARGTIFADEPQTPLVYIPLEDGNIQAVRVIPSKPARKGDFETPERFTEGWVTKGEGTVTAGPKYVYIGNGKVGDHAYKSVSAVDKETGKVVWTESSAGMYLEYQNNWSNKNSGARIYGVSSDGRVISYKEKRRDTAEIVIKKPKETDTETDKPLTGKKKEEMTAETPAKPDEKKPDEKKPDEKKPDEAKPDEKKPDAPAKPEVKKPDDAKPEEKK